MLMKKGAIVKCRVQQAIESRRKERLAFDPGNFAGLNCRKGTEESWHQRLRVNEPVRSCSKNHHDPR
jgi:hypothetical protein